MRELIASSEYRHLRTTGTIRPFCRASVLLGALMLACCQREPAPQPADVGAASASASAVPAAVSAAASGSASAQPTTSAASSGGLVAPGDPGDCVGPRDRRPPHCPKGEASDVPPEDGPLKKAPNAQVEGEGSVVEGSLKGFERVIALARQKARACYLGQMFSTGRSASGSTSFEMRVGPDGATTGVSLNAEGSLSPDMQTCVRRSLAGMFFDNPTRLPAKIRGEFIYRNHGQ